MHKFAVGQIVKLTQNDLPADAVGSYVIIRLVSGDESAPRYRIKSAAEALPRIVRESEISLTKDRTDGRVRSDPVVPSILERSSSE